MARLRCIGILNPVTNFSFRKNSSTAHKSKRGSLWTVHRSEEANTPTSSGHKFFKSEPVEKIKEPWIAHIWICVIHLFTLLSKVPILTIRGPPGQTQYLRYWSSTDHSVVSLALTKPNIIAGTDLGTRKAGNSASIHTELPSYNFLTLWVQLQVYLSETWPITRAIS